MQYPAAERYLLGVHVRQPEDEEFEHFSQLESQFLQEPFSNT